MSHMSHMSHEKLYIINKPCECKSLTRLYFYKILPNNDRIGTKY